MVISDLTARLNHFQKGHSLSTDCEDLTSANGEVCFGTVNLGKQS